jgi:hypothetical protein
MNRMVHALADALKTGMLANSPHLLNMPRDIIPATIRKKDTAKEYLISLNTIWISSMKYFVLGAVDAQEVVLFLSISSR